MYKKLIGYKLIKPEYKEASDALLNDACVKWDKAANFRGYYHLILNSETISNLKIAGVLDLWFEPVYEESVIPEYVECIKKVHNNSSPKVGEIIKSNSRGNLTGICSYNSITYNTCFKPSTKEAFDLQNQPKTKTKQIFTKEQEDYIKNLINDEIKKLQ